MSQLAEPRYTDRKLDLIGTFRSRTPEQTREEVWPLLPRFGITRVARVTGLDRVGIPTSICIRPNARHLATAQGKGTSELLADISAVMESIEGYHAEHVPAPPAFHSYRDLKNHGDVLDPRIMVRGPRWAAWSESYPMRWLQAVDLIGGRPIQVPFIAVTMNSTTAQPEFAILEVSTNGLASGNSWAEAVCHALYEIIERDSEFTWSELPSRQQARTLVDLDTIDVAFLRELIQKCKSANQLPLIWEITGPLQVPSYRCVLVDRSPGRMLGRFHGSGAHLSREVALSRALTEAAQARLTWIAGSREDIFPSLYADLHEVNRAHLKLPLPRRAFRESVSPAPGRTFQDDIDWLIERLRSCRYRHAAVYTHPTKGLPFSVVTVLVPGMRFSGNRL